MAKGNLTFTVDLPNVDQIMDEIEDEIDEAATDALNSVAREGREVANDHIRAHGRVWNKELLNSWVPTTRKLGDGQKLVGWTNYADHASVVDDGATYTDKKPPFRKLARYVRSEYPNVQSEADVYMVTKELQDTIYKNGIIGINYSNVAARYMDATIEREINKEIERRL